MKEIIDYIHVDLWRLFSSPSHSSVKYFLSIVDNYSRKLWNYPYKIKD